MRFTDSQIEYVNKRIKMRLGVFVNKAGQEISVREYKCSCGHTEEYLLFGECPKCLKPISYKNLRYKLGTQGYLAYELGISLQRVQTWLSKTRENVPDERLKHIAKILDVKVEDIKHA